MKFFPYIYNRVALDTGMCASITLSSNRFYEERKEYLCQTS